MTKYRFIKDFGNKKEGEICPLNAFVAHHLITKGVVVRHDIAPAKKADSEVETKQQKPKGRPKVSK